MATQYPSRPITAKGQKSKRRGLKVTRAANRQEKDWMDRVADFGCILSYFKTGISGTPCHIHHLLTGRIPGRRGPHSRTIGLAPHYHRQGPEALHSMGLEPWQQLHGVTELELFELTRKLLNKGKPK